MHGLDPETERIGRLRLRFFFYGTRLLIFELLNSDLIYAELMLHELIFVGICSLLAEFPFFLCFFLFLLI